jgi:predicted  nucleic acid-binding Zn-ribbon protein
MANELDNIVLEHLRHIRSKVDTTAQDVTDIKVQLAAMQQHMAGFHAVIAIHSDELNQLRQRIDRIEKRLDLADS